MNQLLKKITKEQYLLLISIIPIILLVLVSLFNSNVQNRNEINNELIQSVECKLYKNQINQLIESDNIIIYKNYLAKDMVGLVARQIMPVLLCSS